ncbi:hypothetical protein GCM10009853_020040 [Glycomyces scopariae]|uniref:Uncharacterized protein n=1 Tax=Glycomyces sambucus TaxID=380244 RepID=A0A1G9JLM5_9ACTN|nr:hypothetical protein [Glycomyces sambucus]SDL38457.1 hypothetical protein SAMN05216298_3731 [Glycomyces sambucus]
MKPARLFKKIGAAVAAGLIALGLIAGTAYAASEGGGSGEISANEGGGSGEISTAGPTGESGGGSGEISDDETDGGSGEISDVLAAGGGSGELSFTALRGSGELS